MTITPLSQQQQQQKKQQQPQAKRKEMPYKDKAKRNDKAQKFSMSLQLTIYESIGCKESN